MYVIHHGGAFNMWCPVSKEPYFDSAVDEKALIELHPPACGDVHARIRRAKLDGCSHGVKSLESCIAAMVPRILWDQFIQKYLTLPTKHFETVFIDDLLFQRKDFPARTRFIGAKYDLMACSIVLSVLVDTSKPMKTRDIWLLRPDSVVPRGTVVVGTAVGVDRVLCVGPERFAAHGSTAKAKEFAFLMVVLKEATSGRSPEGRKLLLGQGQKKVLSTNIEITEGLPVKVLGFDVLWLEAPSYVGVL